MSPQSSSQRTFALAGAYVTGQTAAASSSSTSATTSKQAVPAALLESKAGLSRPVPVVVTGQDKPLSSMSPRLPDPDGDPAGGKETKHGPGRVQSATSRQADQRFAALLPRFAALARCMQEAHPVGGTRSMEVQERNGHALIAAMVTGFEQLLRGERLDSEDEALSLLRTFAPAVEAHFPAVKLLGNNLPGWRQSMTVRESCVGLLLAHAGPVSSLTPETIAEAILPVVSHPAEWVSQLLVHPGPFHPLATDQFTSMLDCILRVAGARNASHDWQAQAVSGLALTQQRRVELLAGKTVLEPGAGDQTVAQARVLARSIELRALACGRAARLAPQALATLLEKLTWQVERLWPSTLAALEAQALTAARLALMDAGPAARDTLVAVVQGLDRAVMAARPAPEQRELRDAIRRGVVRAMGTYFDTLKTELPPYVFSDAGLRSQLARMVDASRFAMLKALSAQAPVARSA